MHENNNTDQYVSHTSKIISYHSEKHIHEFTNEKFGPDLGINNKEDLKRHIENTLKDNDTKAFKVTSGPDKNTIYAYNGKTNTFIVIPGQEKAEPTCYRPKDFSSQFQNKIDRNCDTLGLDKDEFTISNINELDLGRDYDTGSIEMTINAENAKETDQQLQQEKEITERELSGKETQDKEIKDKEMEDILKEARQLEEAAQAREQEAQSRER